VTRFADSSGVLIVGIGGGGDVVGAIGLASAIAPTPAVVGGITWERRPIDPIPGPRRLDELVGASPLNDVVALCGPQTSGPGGFLFCESHAAAFLGRDTVLVDPNPGPAVVGAALADAAVQLACDLVVLLDVGGDVLAHGGEAGLASPLADAVLLAAAPAIESAGIATIGAVFGIGCDGELTPDEVLERLDELPAVDDVVLDGAMLDRLEAACRLVPPEASLMAVRAARGERGSVVIRGGRRSVPLTEHGGRLVLFHTDDALAGPAHLAAAVVDAPSLEAAHAILEARGVRTELRYETDAASQ
jgi:hypothetical protein